MENRKLYFCTKCGFDGWDYDYRDNKCFFCEDENIEIVPDKYVKYLAEIVPVLKTELEDEFIEEVVKKSPNFSQEAFDRRQNWIKRGTELYNASQQSKTTSNSNKPKCPTCGSTKVHPISIGKKAIGFLAVGIFSKNFGKSYECDNCKYRW